MPRQGTIRTSEQKAVINQKAREKRAAYRALNPLPPRLTTEERKARQQERQRKVNAINKAKRQADRKSGIAPNHKPLTEAQKEAMRLRARKRREEYRQIHPPRVPMTPEGLKISQVEKSRRYYEKRLTAMGKSRQIEVKKRNKEPKDKPQKMEKILKARPERKVSEKVVKPVKIDNAKQDDVIRIRTSEEGRVKVRLDDKTEVYAKPGYDIDALRRKFGRV